MERFLTNLLLLVLVAIASAMWLSQGDRLTWLEGLAPIQALAATPAEVAPQATAPSRSEAPVFAPPVAPGVAQQVVVQPQSQAMTNPLIPPGVNPNTPMAVAPPSASLTGQIAAPSSQEAPEIAAPPPVDLSPPVVPPLDSQNNAALPPLNEVQGPIARPEGPASNELFPAPYINPPPVSAPNMAAPGVPQGVPYGNPNGPVNGLNTGGMVQGPPIAQPPAQAYSLPTEVPLPQMQPADGGGLPPVGQPYNGQPSAEAASAATVPGAPAHLVSATPVANVNGEVILAGDVFPAVDRMMAERLAEIPENQRDEIRIQLAKQRLNQLVEMQLLYNDAMRNVPKENLPKIEEQLNKQFDAEELPNMMKSVDVQSVQQLDEFLRLHGDSVERAKRRFRQEVLARQWLGQHDTGGKEEITHNEMLAYYREHEQSYHFPARARWEQLQVRISSVSSPQEARRKIAWMGNQIIDGASFAEVAKAHSDGYTAKEGGARDWTTQGSLVSNELDRALFTLPVGELSPIIEEDNALTIVRVVERQNAGKTSFLEAQTEIKEEIRKERHNDTRKEYLDELHAQARIWNIFDDPQAEAIFATGPKQAQSTLR